MGGGRLAAVFRFGAESLFTTAPRASEALLAWWFGVFTDAVLKVLSRRGRLNVATAVAQPMSWDRLTASREWHDLSAPRKVWLTTFLANGGDALDATRTAYPSVSARSLRIMSSQLKGHHAILAALELYNGGVTRAFLISEVRLNLAKAEHGSVAAQRLLSQLERLTLGGQESEAKFEEAVEHAAEVAAAARFRVGEIVIQHGAKFQVTAVNAAGQITAAEELK